MARRKRKKPGEEEAEFVTKEDRIIATYKEKITNPLTGIRSHCVECMGGSVHLVAECASVKCSLHPFRMGKNTMHGSHGKTKAKKQSSNGADA